MKTTQAQRRATDTYRKKNPEKIRYQNTLGALCPVKVTHEKIKI